MKKTVFILTLLLPFCFLFAQPQSEVDQMGNDNSVVVDQTGEANYSWVYTRGNDNAPSFVTQVGDGINDSYVDQGDGGNYVDGNTADVTQTNHSTLILDDNYSQIDQDGNYNRATVTQIDVQPLFGPRGRDSYIDQDGDYNKAWVSQEGKRLTADIYQLGNWNTGRVKQEGTRLNGDIDQYGNDNFAEVKQEGYRQNGIITQDGENGTAKIYQGKRKWVNSGTESGFNEASIHQDVNVNGGLAEQHQEGRQNYAYIYQDAGGASEAIQIQVNTKTHYTMPRGTDVNIANITQFGGSANEAYQLQHFSTPGNPNEANVWQDGNSNYSLETQYGGGNSSNVNQVGDGNSSDVTQNYHSIFPPTFGTLPSGF